MPSKKKKTKAKPESKYPKIGPAKGNFKISRADFDSLVRNCKVMNREVDESKYIIEELEVTDA